MHSPIDRRWESVRLQLFRRLSFLFRACHHDDDLAEELAFHREMKARELADAGLPPHHISAAAHRAVGNELTARQRARDVWIWPWLQEIGQDLRFAVRLLARDRGFAITAVLVLGLGIGVNNMMFTLIYTHTLRSLPIPDADRVLFVSLVDERSADRPLSYPELVEFRRASSFQAVAAYASAPVTVGEQGRAPDRFEGAYTTADAIEVIGRQPVLGRAFVAGDDAPGAPRVAILGASAWRTRYDGDSRILGQTILVNGEPATVIGVMPRRSGFPMSAEVFLPLAHMPGLATEKRDARTLRVLGRLRDRVRDTDARLEIESIVERASHEHPLSSRGLRARVVPINQRFLGRVTDPAWLAFLAASFIVVVVSSATWPT